MTKNTSILVVEDDHELSEGLKKGLVEKGYNVQLCGKVVETMAKLHNQKYDCVVFDLHLEGGSGESIISHVRNHKKEPNFETPIIVMSGYLEPETVKRIVPMVQGMLVKPFPTDSLFSKVEAVLKNKH